MELHNAVNRRFAPIRLFLYMIIKKYTAERFSLPKALLLYPYNSFLFYY